jgi:hypothetical protein
MYGLCKLNRRLYADQVAACNPWRKVAYCEPHGPATLHRDGLNSSDKHDVSGDLQTQIVGDARALLSVLRQ